MELIKEHAVLCILCMTTWLRGRGGSAGAYRMDWLS